MKRFPKGIAVILFAVIFNFFFWAEKFALNLVIFTIIFGGLLTWMQPEGLKKRQTLLAIVGISITSLSVIYHNSLLSKFMLFSSIFLYIAALLEKEIKTIYYLIPSGFLGIITSPFRKHSFFSMPKTGLSGKSFKWLKLSLIPILLTVVFATIYSIANPVFANKLNGIIENLGDYLANIFEHYPFARFIFIGTGLLIGIGVYYYQSLHLFYNSEAAHDVDLKRIRFKFKSDLGQRDFPKMGLKTENSIAVLTLISLNVLLLFLNLLDINVFFVQDHAVNSDFSSSLHKGTWMLIFSIILSAGIVLYIFRKNLNFYSKNSLLKIFTYIWIAQNIILSFSVITRVYHYILHHGLAYKRIGVLVFVTATIIGLLSLVLKVKNRKSVFYLLRVNGVAIYLILIATAMFNWDYIIVNHNISHAKTKKIDYLFELTLSDKTLPLLHQNRDLLKTHNYKYRNYSSSFPWVKNQSLTERLDSRIDNFKTKYKKRTWLSWNLSDQSTAEYFKIE